MRQRIVVYFVAIALVSIATTTLLSTYQSRQATERQHVDNSIRLAKALRDNVERVLDKARADVEIVARTVEKSATDQRSLSRELQRLGRTMRDYSDLTLIDEAGLILASTTYDFHGDWRYRVGFQEALNRGEAMSGFHRLPATGRLALAFYSRFALPNGRPVVAAVQLDASKVAEIPLSAGVQGGPLAFIVDERGLFVAHPQPAYLLEPAWTNLTAKMRHDAGRAAFSMYGRPFLGGYAMMPLANVSEEAAIAGWAVVVAQEDQQVFGFLQATLLRVQLVGAVMFVALVMLGWQLASRIATPIERLVRAAEQVGQRDFAVSVSPGGPPEVARLGAAFNTMVTEIGQYQARLLMSEQRYRDLTDLLPQTVFETDERGVFTYVNRAGLATFGYDPREVVGRPELTLLSAIIPEERPRATEIWRRLLAGVHTQGNRYRAVRRDGVEVPILVYSAAFDLASGRRGLRGIVIDISELERKDAIIRQAQRLETIGLLAGGLAHDLNNVLGGILGAVGLIRHHLRPQRQNLEEIGRMLDLVDGSVARASDMVQKLLAMSRRKDLSLALVDLNVAVEHVAAVCRGTFERSVEIVTAVSDRPAVVRADASQLEQVLLNLAINAYHAVTLMRPEEEQSRGGRVSIALRRESVDEQAPPDGLALGLVPRSGDYWVMSVSDDGVGISEQVMAHAFEPFYTTKQPGKGSGLGLAVIHSIAQQNSGLVTLRSKVGQGTTFEFYLPASDDSLSGAKPWDTAPSFEPGSGHILVVDDDPVILRMTRLMLVACGYEVSSAQGGREALDIVAAATPEFALALVDLSMPHMSGKELIDELRKTHPSLPCALMTGHQGDPRVAEIERLGVAFVLPKPFDLSQLAAKVASALKAGSDDLEPIA